MITKPWKRQSFVGNALVALLLFASVGLLIPILPRLLNTRREIPAYDESQYVELGHIESERLPALVEHEFFFRNTSSESVSVLAVNSSCSCTTYPAGPLEFEEIEFGKKVRTLTH